MTEQLTRPSISPCAARHRLAHLVLTVNLKAVLTICDKLTRLDDSLLIPTFMQFSLWHCNHVQWQWQSFLKCDWYCSPACPLLLFITEII